MIRRHRELGFEPVTASGIWTWPTLWYDHGKTAETVPPCLEACRREHVKELIFTDDVRSFTTYTFKPQLRTVGPKYGKVLGAIQGILKGLDGNAAMDELKATGFLTFTANGVEVKLAEEDLLIDMKETPGFVTENAGEVTVVLDTNLSEELIEEGFVREIISKVQTMRKEADFNVTDHIRITYACGPVLKKIFETKASDIMGDMLSDELAEGPAGFTKDWDINGEACTLGVEVISK